MSRSHTWPQSLETELVRAAPALPLIDVRHNKTDDGNEQRGKVQGGSLVGRVKVINGGVGGDNRPLAEPHVVLCHSHQSGFCQSSVSHIRMYARELGAKH